jgi:hypothetical protein
VTKPGLAGRPWVRALLAATPAGLLATSLGLGKVVRDCSLTCNVGFELAPVAILAIALLTVPLSELRARAETRWSYRAWQVGSALLAAVSLLAFRALMLFLLRRQEAAFETDTDPTPWIEALRWAYVGFYVWIGGLLALLGANAFGHVFRLHPEGEQERAALYVTAAIVAGGVLGSLIAGTSASFMFEAFGWRFELVRDNLLVGMALILLLQIPVVLVIDRIAGPRRPIAPSLHPDEPEPVGLRQALGLVWADSTLARLATLLFVGGAADTFLKYIFYWLVSEGTTPSMQTGRTLYFATFYLWLNTASLLMLLVGTGRLLRRFGLAFALLSAPLAVVFGAASLAVTTALALMYALRVVESTVRNTLYDPGLDQLYLGMGERRAGLVRPVLNGLVSRLGEGAGALAILVLSFGVGLGLKAMIGVFLAVVVGWIVAAFSLRRALPLAMPERAQARLATSVQRPVHRALEPGRST